MTREEQLFNDALSLPPSERALFLQRACAGEPELHARLVELLAAHAASEYFLGKPALPPPPPPAGEQPGDVIGHYLLVRKLGEGGCGAVYLAEQSEPVRRPVALKVIKLGMDTREVIARFDAERQALALMNHPNIARVYDAGATAAGRLYFVMEYVDGVPITQFCDARKLPVPDRLHLFASLCQALQHAHQKGVIHRDLKPSNILVALQDGVPVPKIIDFGIAKATQGRLTEHTFVTHFAQVIGTPAYMSPEQADLRDTDIDTRSDIYSLGVLLYELLAGKPPFDPRSLVRAGMAEIRRIIREVEPPRPSTVLSTLGSADRTTVAQRRAAAPERLTSALRGDLDWIVMRCLEKDRARRYGTANELAEDIRRHLRSEPVLARPPSAIYRARRFVRRHRVACAAAAAVALALAAGAVVSTWQAIRATRAEHAARLAQAAAQRRQAEAEDLLTFMLGDFRAELAKIGKLKLLDAVGDKASAYFAALDPRDLSDDALANQARALYQVGEVRMGQARYDEAERAFRASFARSSTLTGRHPKNSDMVFDRGQAEFWIGFAARRKGDLATARQWFNRYHDTAEELSQLGGDPLRAQQEFIYGYHAVAVMEYETTHYAAAESAFQAERAMVESALQAHPHEAAYHAKLADLALWLGLTAEWTGALDQALLRFTEATAKMSDLVSAHPGDTSLVMKLAVSHVRRAGLLAIIGRKGEAASAYDQAGKLFAGLLAHDPRNNQWRIEASLLRLDRIELSLADPDNRISPAAFESIRAEIAALGAPGASSQVVTRLLARTWRLAGRTLLSTDPTAARAALLRAVELSEKPIRDGLADDWMTWEFCQAHLLLAALDLHLGNDGAAKLHATRIVEVLQPKSAGSNDWRILAAEADALAVLGRSDEARLRQDRLQRFAYQPVDPFKAAKPAVSSTNQHP